MRLLLAAPVLLLLAGCASPAEEPVAPEPAATAGDLLFEGRFSKAHVQGQEVQRSGGIHAFESEGWRNVVVRLDIMIDALLYLLPPGCASADDACALVFDSRMVAESWLVPQMEAGTWTAVLDLPQAAYTYAESVYAMEFVYQDA
jgi:hypothetical protein